MASQTVTLLIQAINGSQAAFDAVRADLQRMAQSSEQLNEQFSRLLTQSNGFHNSAGLGVMQLSAMLDVGTRLVNVLSPLVKEAIDYNKQMEISRLGISAILTSMTVIKDAQGNVLTGAAKWNESTRYTAQAQGELQKIAMTTAVTYKELVAAYQGVLAPALSAKMNFKDVAEFTGLMANSVKAIGLPMQQIVQESRDLVAGTIDQNSQLSKSLGITNEDVKKWREKGTVFEEVKKRLVGFVYASNEFNSTWEGAWSNFKDIAQRALGEGLNPAFNAIKREMDAITEKFVDIKRDAKTGDILDIQIKPEVMAALKNIAFEFNRILDVAKKIPGILIDIAEPAFYTAIIVQCGRVALAIKAIGIEAQTANRALAGSVIGTMLIGAHMLVKGGIDAARDDRETDSVKSIYSKIGGKPGGEIDNLTPAFYRQVVDKTGLTPEQIALALKQKQMKFYPQEIDSDAYFTFDQTGFDKAATDRTKASGSMKGNKVPLTKEQQKQLDDNAIAAAKLKYQAGASAADMDQEIRLEAIREELRQKKVLWEKGELDQQSYITAEADAKQNEIDAQKQTLNVKMGLLGKEYDATANHYREQDAADKAFTAYSQSYDKMDLDYTKLTNKAKADLDDKEVKRIQATAKEKEAIRDNEIKAAETSLKLLTEANSRKVEAGEITSTAALTSELELRKQIYELTMHNALLSGAAEKTDADREKHLAKFREAQEKLNGLLGEQNYLLDATNRKDETRRLSKEKSLLDAKLAVANANGDWRSAGSLRQQQLENERASQLNQPGLDVDQITAINTQFDTLIEKQKLLRDPFEGMKRGLQSYADAATNLGSQMEGALTNAFKGIEDSLVKFVQTGKLNFNDLANSIISDLVRIAIRSTITGPLASGLGSMVGSLLGSAVVAHDGGLIVPRFHFGGLASDEVPAVLQTRERVLSREQNVLFENFSKKTESGATPSVTINIENTTGQKMAAKSGGMQFDGKGFVISTIIENVQQGGVLRGLMAGG